MTKLLLLIGLPIAFSILGIIASTLTQKQTPVQALQVTAKSSEVIAIKTASTDNSGQISRDRLAHPPIRQTFTTEPYQLTILTEDNWRTPLTQAKLEQDDIVLWEETLPHQYGPKFVLIGSQGNVLLLDEFINVASPHAITLIGTNGKVIAQHSFEAIAKTLNLNAADLTKQATTGWWISAPPTLIDGNRATVSTGGTLLEIDLTTGEISQG